MILCLASLAPLPGLVLIPLATHGLRRGLRSVAASRLSYRLSRWLYKMAQNCCQGV